MREVGRGDVKYMASLGSGRIRAIVAAYSHLLDF
jgi:hypothetical protein